MAVDKEIDDKIKEAARILREDGMHVGLRELRARFDKHFPDEAEADPPADPADPNAPTPPPKKDAPEPPEGDRPRKGGWWPEGSLDPS